MLYHNIARFVDVSILALLSNCNVATQLVFGSWFSFQVAKSSLHFSGGIEYGVIPDPTLIDQIHNGDFTIQAWF